MLRCYRSQLLFFKKKKPTSYNFYYSPTTEKLENNKAAGVQLANNKAAYIQLANITSNSNRADNKVKDLIELGPIRCGCTHVTKCRLKQYSSVFALSQV